MQDKEKAVNKDSMNVTKIEKIKVTKQTTAQSNKPKKIVAESANEEIKVELNKIELTHPLNGLVKSIEEYRNTIKKITSKDSLTHARLRVIHSLDEALTQRDAIAAYGIIKLYVEKDRSLMTSIKSAYKWKHDIYALRRLQVPINYFDNTSPNLKYNIGQCLMDVGVKSILLSEYLTAK